MTIKAWWRSLTTNRLNSRSFQADLDWFRFAVAARVHEARLPAGASGERDAIVDELAKARAVTHTHIARSYYTNEVNRILGAVYKATDGHGVL